MLINKNIQGIYCINLDHRVDRWAKSQVELSKLNILDRTIRFSAIENHNGAVGCLLSHRKIIEVAQEAGHKNILIFEDDFLVCSPDMLVQQINKLPYGNFDMFYLGGTFLNSQLILENYDPNFFIIQRGVYGVFGVVINERIFDLLLSILPQNGDLRAIKVNNFDEIYANVIQPYCKVLIGKKIYLEHDTGYSDISLGIKGNEYIFFNRLGFFLAKYAFARIPRRILFYLRYKIIFLINLFGGKIVS